MQRQVNVLIVVSNVLEGKRLFSAVNEIAENLEKTKISSTESGRASPVPNIRETSQKVPVAKKDLPVCDRIGY